MALNITLNGYAYHGDGSISNSDMKYQAYFYRSNTGSSPSQWNNVRVVENTGYWNINLGDGDWLTQDGSATIGDIVVLVFWSPVTADRMDDCGSLTQWGICRMALDGSDVYTFDVQIQSNICPNLSWSLASDGLVGETITANNSSNDSHSWDYGSTEMWHRNSWYTSLMTVNSVDNTDYDWDDGHQDNDLSGASNGYHVYSSAGDYTIEIVIEDECGCTVTGTDTITIKNNAPVPDIEMIPANPDPNEQVFFRYVGTDEENAITNIEWTINDSGSYGNTNTNSPTNARDDVIPHDSGSGTEWYGESPNSGAFTNPGNHVVEIVVTWWDGFANQTINYSETFNQRRFTGPTVDFDQDPDEANLNENVSFTNTSSDTDRVGTGLPNHKEYTWYWDDDGNVETTDDVSYGYVLNKVPTTAVCKVKLCAEWSDGWDTHTECVEKDVVFDTTITITEEDCYYNLNIIGTSEDGSVTGYGWTVYSGTENGPWTEIWRSPVDLEQQDKKVCFTAEGWYKIEGEVAGNGASTYDDDLIYVTEVCEPGDTVSICPPEMSGREIDDGKKMRAVDVRPSVRGRYIWRRPDDDDDDTDGFPGPTNL